MKKRVISGTIISNDSKWIYDYFGWDSICPNDVTSFLNEVNGTDDIVLTLNSQGGNVIAADEIYTAIASYKGKISMEVIMAGSAASEIMTACENKISPVGKVMIHNASIYASGDYRAMDQASQMLQTVNQSIRNAYKAKTGLTDEELKDLMDKETWMTAEDAVKYGFSDGILELTQVSNQSIPTVYNSAMPLLDEDKIKELRNMIVSNNMQSILQNQIKEGSHETMTVDELRAQYPELVAKIETDAMNGAQTQAVNAERERIKAIESIEASIGDKELINEAKYGENPMDAKELAFQAMQRHAALGTSFLAQVTNDVNDSGVDKVQAVQGVGTTPEALKEAQAQVDADAIKAAAEAVNALKGGKR